MAACSRATIKPRSLSILNMRNHPPRWGTGSGANLQNILMNERHQNKPMDHLHCPLGSLREEAQKTAAIGLRIAMDNLRLRWSERGQLAYEKAKKATDETLAAWNEHIRKCEMCRDAKPGLVPARAGSSIRPTPAGGFRPYLVSHDSARNGITSAAGNISKGCATS